MSEELNYQYQDFKDGDTLAAQDLIDIEKAIINNQGKIKGHTTAINNNTSNITKNTNAIQTNSENIADNKGRLDNHDTEIAEINTALGGKLNSSVTDDTLKGKVLYINDSKNIGFKTTEIESEANPDSITVIDGVNYYISQGGKYMHYRGIKGELIPIGAAAAGKIYRATYGPLSVSETSIPGVPSNVDLEYVFRLWEISAEDYREGSVPSLDTGNKWITVSTLVIGADIERSIVEVELSDKGNVNNILWSDIEAGEQVYLVFDVKSTNLEGTKPYRLSYTVSNGGLVIAQGTVPGDTLEMTSISLNVTKHIKADSNNTFSVEIIDALGSKGYLGHTIRCVKFTSKAVFEDRIYYQNEANIYLTYTVSGIGLDKTTYLFIRDEDGKAVKSYEWSTSLGTESKDFLIPTDMTHGSYLIECYSESKIGANKIQTDKWYYDMLLVEVGNDIPIISSSQKPGIETLQYNNIVINYRVYNSDQNNPTVIKRIIKNGTQLGEEEETLTSKDGQWLYKVLESGNYIFQIETTSLNDANPVKEIIEIPVKVNPLEIKAARREVVESSLLIDFDASKMQEFASEQRQVEVSPGVYREETFYQLKVGSEYKGGAELEDIFFQTNPQFNWINGGYKTRNGNPCFVIKAGDSITVNRSLFGNSYNGPNVPPKGIGETGRTFNLIFQTENVTDSDKPFLDYFKEEDTTITTTNKVIEWDTTEQELIEGETEVNVEYNDKYRKGIRMYPQETQFYCGAKTMKGATLKLPYSENDEINFCLTLSKTPTSGGTADQDFLGTPIVYGYEDGVSTRPFVGVNYASFDEHSSFTLGGEDCECDIIIYKFKLFNTCLTDEDVLTEFILDGASGEIISERDKRNDFSEQRGENTYEFKFTPDADITNEEEFFEALSKKCPDLRIIFIDAEGQFTNDKKDKRNCTIKQWYYNGRLKEDNWIAENAKHSGQGTSSNNYAAAGRNLNLYLEGATIRPRSGTAGETLGSVSLTESSIPAKVFNIKVNIASSENANNALLQKRYNEFNPYTRPFVDKQKIEVEDADGKITTISPKDTMEFHNCVVFIRENGGQLQEVYRKPQTNSYETSNGIRFYGIGNIGDSKDTDDTRMTDPDDIFEFIVEIVDVASAEDPLSDFPLLQEKIGDKYASELLASDTMDDKGTSSYEFRFIHDDKKKQLVSLTNEQQIDAADLLKINYTLTDAESEGKSEEEINALKIEKIQNGFTSLEVSTVFDVCKKLWEDFYKTVVATDESIESITKKGESYLVTYDDQTNAIYNSLAEIQTYVQNNAALPEADRKYVLSYELLNSIYEVKYNDSSSKEYTDLALMRQETAPENWDDLISEKAVLDSIIYYSLFTTRYTMVDNRAKNTFWHFGKCDDAGNRKWDLSFDYDNDTSLGINNSGELVYRYGYEDLDYEDSDSAIKRPVFREHDSTFFCRLLKYCADEFPRVYQLAQEKAKAKQKNAWSSDSLITEFDNWQNQFPERLWKEDARKKYINSYNKPANSSPTPSSTFLTEMACGRKKYQRRQFERNQYNYMGIKYKDSEMPCIYFRARNSGSLDGVITLKLGKNSYLAYGSGSGSISNAAYKRITNEANEAISISGDMYKIWGTPWILSLEGLGGLKNVNLVSLANAYRLSELDASNQSMTQLQVTKYGPIKTIDLSNTQNLSQFTTADSGQISNDQEENLGGDSAFSTLPNLIEVKAEGSGLKIYKFSTGAPIETLILPGSATEIELPQLNQLKTFKFQDNLKGLQKLLIDKGSLIPQDGADATVSDYSGKKITARDLANNYAESNKILKMELIGIDWSEEDTSLTDKLYELKDNGLPAVSLSGKIYFSTFDNLTEARYKERWPDLELSWGSMIYKYRVTFTGGKEDIVEEVNSGSEVYAPQSDPKKLPTNEYYYTFSHWYKEKTSEDIDAFEGGKGVTIISDTTFYAKFQENQQMYKVTFTTGTGASAETILETEIAYGTDFSKDSRMSELKNAVASKEIIGSDEVKLFKDWSKTIYNITGELKYSANATEPDIDETDESGYAKKPITISAVWDEATTVPSGQTNELTPAQIALALKKGLVIFGDPDNSALDTGDKIKIPLGFRMPTKDYFGKEPTYPFKGKDTFTNGEEGYTNGEEVIESNTQLLKGNSDWTMLLDVSTATRPQTGYGIILSCPDSMPLGGGGLKVIEGYNYGSNGRYVIEWYGRQYKFPIGNTLPYSDPAANYTGGTHREIMVLQHKKAEPKRLYCYISNHYGDDIISATIEATTDPWSLDTFVSIGGRIVNGSIQNATTANIHQCMIWENFLLSEADINQLIKWPKQDFYFTVVGGGLYEDPDAATVEKTTAIDLWGLQGFERSMPQFGRNSAAIEVPVNNYFSFAYTKDFIEKSAIKTNKVECTLATWMNTRFYDAIPDHWKRILAEPKIPCMAYTRQDTDVDKFSGGQLLKPRMHVWLQSTYELTGDGRNGTEGQRWLDLPYLGNKQNRFRTWAPYNMFEYNREVTNSEWTGEDPREGDVWNKQEGSYGTTKQIAAYKRAIWGSKYAYLLYRTVSENLNLNNNSFEAALIRTSAPYYEDIDYGYFSFFNEYLAVPCLSIKEV